jgi:hypothetical protein
VKTWANLDAIVGEMQHDRAITMQRHEKVVRPATADRSALQRFVEAVVAFSDEPGPENLERYLAASRSLEEARLSGLENLAQGPDEGGLARTPSRAA